MLPDIGITSNLGPRPERRKLRLEYHIKQRKTLARLLPSFNIISYCSGYSQKERKKLIYPAKHLDDDAPKYKKHNYLLKRLYNEKDRILLILDDDVVPWEKVDQGIDDMVDHLCYYYAEVAPPYPCMYFASAGLRFDAFYRNRPAIVNAPQQVVGWATLYRSDLQLLYPECYIMIDFTFRVHCFANGKEVGKFNSLFWKTFQQKEGESTLVEDHEDRKKGRQEIFEKFLKEKPHLFKRIANGQIRFRRSKSKPVGFPGMFDKGE